MSKPLVSVITPAYNAARFLPEQLASVRAQTYPDWEQWVVNDGSTDETSAIIAAAAAADPRVRPVYQANQGAHAARNAALARADGRFIAFLDADDLWRPEKLERQIGFMQWSGYAITYHWYRTIDVDGSFLSGGPIWMPGTVDYREYLRLNGTIGNLTVLIDREQTGDFQLPDMGAEDFALYLQLLKRHRAYGLFEELAMHRVVPGSLSSNKQATMRWIWDVYRQQERIAVLPSLGYMARYFGRGVAKNVVHKGLGRRRSSRSASQ